MKPAELFIDHEDLDHPDVVTIQSSLNIPPSIVKDKRELYDYLENADDPFRKAKTFLYLTKNKGSFIKQCPGTRYYTCCGYKILHIGTYCNMDCTYCILQSYFHPPMLQYFINQNKMMRELDLLFQEEKTYRVGTGEFTDSLIWDEWTDLSKKLIEKFASQSHVMLELKTKSSNIEKLKRLSHNKKTVISWSVNTESIIQMEEHNTAPLHARLTAAKQCASWGYPIGFHFDPILIYEDCEKDYENVVEKIFSSVSPDNIIWISLGAFRFIPSLKKIIRKRFPDSKIIYGEFIQGLDNKMRYFKPLRIKLYQRIIKRIREFSCDVPVYFCMEDNVVWHKSLGFVPSEIGGLPNMLNESAVLHCDLKRQA